MEALEFELTGGMKKMIKFPGFSFSLQLGESSLQFLKDHLSFGPSNIDPIH